MFRSRGRQFLLLAVFVTLSVALLGCQNDKNPNQGVPGSLSGNITAVGSTALQPLVEQAAQDFMADNSGVVITVQGGGSGTGLTQVSQGGADIGNSDIFADEKQGIHASALTDHRVAVVGFAVVTHPGVGIDGLTNSQLIDIFTGKVTNWKNVGGSDQKIVVINRAAGSGTRSVFEKWGLKGAIPIQEMEEDASGTVRKVVAETPGAISYLAISYVDTSIRALALDGVFPKVENITSGEYPIWSYEHMYTNGEPSALIKAFLDYMLSAEIQENLVGQQGYIAVTAMRVSRDANSIP